jgi:hypothetical protein
VIFEGSIPSGPNYHSSPIIVDIMWRISAGDPAGVEAVPTVMLWKIAPSRERSGGDRSSGDDGRVEK